MARQNNMTWNKKIALKYANDFGVNVMSTYNERGLVKRVHTINKERFHIKRYGEVPKINRNWKARITRTYSEVRKQSAIDRLKQLYRQMSVQQLSTGQIIGI